MKVINDSVVGIGIILILYLITSTWKRFDDQVAATMSSNDMSIRQTDHKLAHIFAINADQIRLIK